MAVITMPQVKVINYSVVINITLRVRTLHAKLGGDPYIRNKETDTDRPTDTQCRL